MTVTEASHKAAEAIIQQTKEMAAAPPIVFKLMSLLKKPNVHNQDIIDVIRYDEQLTAKLLRLCNTAFFKPSMPIESVDQAVLRLGNSNIFSIVAAISVTDKNAKMKRSTYMNPYDIWRQSVTASIAAKNLSSQCRNTTIHPDTAFTAGLLHNIGMVVLNSCTLDDIAQIIPIALEKGISLVEAEQKVLGTDHAEVGATLIEHWHLPEDIIEAVRFHNMPETCPKPLPSLCHLSSLCAHISSGVHSIEQFKDLTHPIAMETLGITEGDFHLTLQYIRDESAQIEAFMMVV